VDIKGFMHVQLIPLVSSLEQERATLTRYIRAIGVLARLVTHRAAASSWRWNTASDYAANQAANIQDLHDARLDRLAGAQLTHTQARNSDPNYRDADDKRHELVIRAREATESQRILIEMFAESLKERSAAINMASKPLDVYTLKDL